MHKERIDKRIKRGFQNLRLSGKLLVIYILAGFASDHDHADDHLP